MPGPLLVYTFLVNRAGDHARLAGSLLSYSSILLSPAPGENARMRLITIHVNATGCVG